MPRGWFGESGRHSLAARGIKSGRKATQLKSVRKDSMFEIEGLPREDIKSSEEAIEVIEALRNVRGILDFVLMPDDKHPDYERMGIRVGSIVQIPREGLYNPDPRFEGVADIPKFVRWLKRTKRVGQIYWKPFPEDRGFYRPASAFFDLRGD